MTVPSGEETARRRRDGLELLRAEREGLPRLHVVSTFNVDLLPPFLAEAYDRAGLGIAVGAGAFGQLSQEILNPASSLYAAEPNEVLLLPASEDLLEPLFASSPSQLGKEDAEALVEERLADLEQLVQTVLERLPAATVVVVVFGTDRAPVGHVLDPQSPERRQALTERFAAGVRALGALSQRVVVVDWDWHVRASGWDAVRDERLWYLGRMRLNPTGCAALADLVALHAAAYRGLARKAVALDFDGLLWGGVIGEAGLGGIDLGEEGVGLAFQDLQRELLKLHDTGVLLVACSKNNPDDAFEVFERHPAMVLQRTHFAAERVNWQDKATNLRELAEELGIGLDSFVFLDDNPVERSWVAQAVPEVLVPEMPLDPTAYPAFLRAAPWFARVETTEADQRRATTYREQGQRRRSQQSATSLEDFLQSLEQEALIEPVHDGSLARAAQLCQRTNQFNLTTKRYTAADLERLSNDPDWELFTLAVRDRFGDSGITGLALLQHDGEETIIDTFLMSCRILGRRLEDVFLAFLAERAAARGASALVGRFEPTAKNAQAANFYSRRGFVAIGDGTFRRDLRAAAILPPAQIAVTVKSNA